MYIQIETTLMNQLFIHFSTFLILSIISIHLEYVICKAGVDLSVATTSNDWQCLISKYNVSFGIIRIYRLVIKL